MLTATSLLIPMSDQPHTVRLADLPAQPFVVEGQFTAYFDLPRRKVKRFFNRQRKWMQRMRRLAFRGR